MAERVIAGAREHTNGLGADIVLDCSGFPKTFVEALRMVRVGGVVVEAGTFVDMGPININPNADICTRNVSHHRHRRRDRAILRAIHAADGGESGPAAVRSHRQPSHAAGARPGSRGAGADRRCDEGGNGAEQRAAGGRARLMGGPAPVGRSPTILDVAHRAGVSKSTVSNVVRGVAGVAEDKRARVLRAVDALGYRPNVLARQLVQQRTTIFGVVVGDLGNPFHAEMARHIERFAAARGYRTMFSSTRSNEIAELGGLESLLEWRVAGILFLAHAGASDVARRLGRGPGPDRFRHLQC